MERVRGGEVGRIGEEEEGGGQDERWRDGERRGRNILQRLLSIWYVARGVHVFCE